jgi:hypothetical protein
MLDRTSRLTTIGSLVAALVASGLALAPARAQTPESEVPETPTDRWHLVGGLHFGTPYRVAVGIGLLRILGGEDSAHGILMVAEPGLDGGKVRLGYAFSGPFATGFTLQAGAIQTWRKPVNADRDRTYAGGELHLVFLLLNAGVGYYTPTSGNGGRVFWTVGLGL